MDDRPPHPIRIAAVPAAHPYVVAVTPDDGSVEVRPDPVVDAAEPSRWWPPAVLDAAWIRRHAHDVDLVHVHFGMESLPEGRLAAALDAAAEARLPVVSTVHDLDNPQLEDQSRHLRDLDVIVPRADALVTLTDVAADRILARWGRRATVLPHPTLLDAGAPRVRPHAGAFVVGMHLRDLRPSIDAVPATRALLASLDALRANGVPAQGRVLVNERTRDPDAVRAIVELVAGRPDCAVVERPRPDDAALVDEVDELDVAWLPYRHGTHSGWVELCYDRAVPVVGPGSLPMAHQHPQEYRSVDGPGGPAEAVRSAIAIGTRPGSTARRAAIERRRHARAAERKGVRRAHAALYRSSMLEIRR